MLMSYAPPIVRLVLAALLTACVPAVYAQSKDPIEVGTAALDRNHFATAYRAWIGPARKGDAMAQNNVGYLYEHGLGLTQSYVEAMAWYRKAANKNLAQAQYNIGTLYYYGYGVERNTREAVRWFRQAAKQELTEGQYMLGVAYYEGQGTVKSAPTAIDLFLKAAKKGHANAQLMAANVYLNGDLGDVDAFAAYVWADVAARSGTPMRHWCVTMRRLRSLALRLLGQRQPPRRAKRRGLNAVCRCFGSAKRQAIALVSGKRQKMCGVCLSIN